MESTLVAWRRRGGIAAAAATWLVMLELHHDARDVITAPTGESRLCQLPGCCLRFLLHLHKCNGVLWEQDETVSRASEGLGAPLARHPISKALKILFRHWETRISFTAKIVTAVHSNNTNAHNTNTSEHQGLRRWGNTAKPTKKLHA